MVTTPHLGLTVWNLNTDPYDHSQLADNWARVDEHDHTPGKGKLITTAAIAPGSITTDLLNASISLPGSSIGSSQLVAGAVQLQHLGVDVLRQTVPIGAVIDWWRPQTSVVVPDGFAICDGTVVSSHDFGVVGSITLPDLRNLFVIGADATKNNDVAGSLADGSANAPGINRIDGAHQVTLTGLQSGVNQNGVTVHGGAHDHTFDGEALGNAGGATVPHFTSGKNTDATFWTMRTDLNNGGHDHTFANRTADNPHNNVPKYIGLLKIMKVKRS
jgi:hypothetical protein